MEENAGGIGKETNGNKPVLLKLEKVTLGYNNEPILRDINLEIFDGVCLGILGPNGTGKTTLLRGLLGLIKPIEGKITWFENDKPEEPRVGYVPQKEYLDQAYPLTIMEVVLMGTYKEKIFSPFISREQKETAMDALKEVNMESISGMLFSKCSGGQRQRVLVARALATGPKVLILDEFTTGIDLAAQKQLAKLLVRLHRDYNKINIFMVTQDIKSLPGIVKEVIWINEGKLVHGSAEKLLHEGYIKSVYDKV